MNRSAVFLGLVLVVIGALFLVGNLFHVDAWSLFWPLALVALGGWLLLRPRISPSGAPVNFMFLGEFRRTGAWQAAAEDMAFFIGDIVLDFTQAVVAPGETRIHVSGFIGDVHVVVPAWMGLRVSSSAFVTDINYAGQKREGFLSPVEFTTANYASIDRKVYLDTAWFVGDIKIRQA